MYSIGELSKIVKLSVDALRYYDEIGLLKPYHVDADTRYRVYSDEQVRDLLAIMEWKQVGFRLDKIAELLRCTDNQHLLALLHERLAELTEKHAAAERSMKLLVEKIKRTEGEDPVEKVKVLVIDDASFMRQVLKDILQRQGGWMVIGEAVDGEEGLKLFKELQPDLVLLDIGMPGLNGIETAAAIRDIDPAARIVMCSAHGQARMVLDSLQNGASGFVVKPFHQTSLIEEIQRTLNGGRNYDRGTIQELCMDSRFLSLDGPLSQPAIQDLQNYCAVDVTVDKRPVSLEALLERMHPLIPREMEV